MRFGLGRVTVLHLVRAARSAVSCDYNDHRSLEAYKGALLAFTWVLDVRVILSSRTPGLGRPPVEATRYNHRRFTA